MRYLVLGAHDAGVFDGVLDGIEDHDVDATEGDHVLNDRVAAEAFTGHGDVDESEVMFGSECGAETDHCGVISELIVGHGVGFSGGVAIVIRGSGVRQVAKESTAASIASVTAWSSFFSCGVVVDVDVFFNVGRVDGDLQDAVILKGKCRGVIICL